MSTPGPRRPWLYDPSAGDLLVRAHRPPSAGAAADVVSDAVWRDVLRLVRWAAATLDCAPGLLAGTAWRTAATSAALLRRLPGLCVAAGLAWPGVPVGPGDADDSGRARLRTATDRLAALLGSPDAELGDPVLLAAVAADVDAVGAAAIALLAEETDWTVRR
ncbi:hypothetical protein [uncultured Modestobacter sp.]|uniref:hypothetical protein n=1 Tax=uncultured Modestobacter sp. TaxID=380048 RepID=UPI002619BB14|nr:hypothetical protein [uncultured Modestobacter sp.]